MQRFIYIRGFVRPLFASEAVISPGSVPTELYVFPAVLPSPASHENVFGPSPADLPCSTLDLSALSPSDRFSYLLTSAAPSPCYAIAPHVSFSFAFPRLPFALPLVRIF